MSIKIAVEQVENDPVSNEEVFVVLQIDVAEGMIKHMSDGMSEKQLKELLAKTGAPDDEIQRTINGAKDKKKEKEVKGA